MRTSLASLIAATAVILAGAPAPATVAPGRVLSAAVEPTVVSESVIAISIDGLSIPALRKLGRRGTPNLHRFMKQGASTLNARTEHEMTVTLPNHTGMVTGRRIEAATGGHGVTWNDDSPTPATVQEAAGGDVASVFTSVHDAGGSTALFAAKTKFSLWQRSWPEAIDQVRILESNSDLVREFNADVVTQDRDFRFLHLSLPDVAGHAHGWMSRRYITSVRRVDRLVGLVVKNVAADSDRRANTTILLTSDHGGHGPTHSDATLLDDYRIAFMARGAGVSRGIDIYAVNPDYRDPRKRRTVYGARRPPVRNGMIANLALDLLGLPPVLDSEFDVEQNLSLRARP